MEGAALPSGGEQDALSPQDCSHVPCPTCPSCPSPGGRAGMWAGSSGAEAAGGQAQAGLFYSRLFPAKKTESDTSTPRGTSCRYPARSCWSPGPVRRHRLCSWGSGRKGMAPLMGGRTAGCWGRATSCSREGQTRYPPSQGLLPASSLLTSPPNSSASSLEKKAGNRSPSQDAGTAASPLAIPHEAALCSPIAARGQLQHHPVLVPSSPGPSTAAGSTFRFTPPAFSGNPIK